MPTSPSASPRKRLNRPRTSEPPSSVATVAKATSVRAKYSAGPNFSASSASGGEKNVSAMVASVPATKEPTAAVVSAAGGGSRRAPGGGAGGAGGEGASPR